MASDYCSIFSRVCIIIINIILAIFGLVLLILGIILHVSIKNVIFTAGITNWTGGAGDLIGSFDDVAIVCIVCGVFILLISILGCVAGAMQNKCVLVTYAIVTAILIILLIIASVMIFGGYLTYQVKSQLEDTIKNYYVGSLQRISKEVGYTTTAKADTTGRSDALDSLMSSLKCCGLNNYKDFDGAAKWKAATVTVTVGGAAVAVKIPVACCKKFSVPAIPANVAELQQCITAPTTTNSYMDIGCWPKLETIFYVYRIPGVAIMIVLILFLLGLFCMTLYILCSSLGSDPEPNYYDDRTTTTRRKDKSRNRQSNNNRNSDMYLPNYQSQENQYGPSPRYGEDFGNYGEDRDYGRGVRNYTGTVYGGSQASTPDWYSTERKALPRGGYNIPSTTPENFTFR